MAEDEREQELDVGRVSKVRVYDNTVTVERSVPNMSSEEHVISGPWKDSPRPQFKRAMASLIPIALKLAEIEGKAWLGTAIVSQVSISKDKRGRRQFSLVVVRSLEHGAITFNTPIRTERSSEEDVGAQYAEPALVKACDRVCQEALIYVNGERTQLVLSLDDKRGEKRDPDEPDERTDEEKAADEEAEKKAAEEGGNKPEGLRAAARKARGGKRGAKPRIRKR